MTLDQYRYPFRKFIPERTQGKRSFLNCPQLIRKHLLSRKNNVLGVGISDSSSPVPNQSRCFVFSPQSLTSVPFFSLPLHVPRSDLYYLTLGYGNSLQQALLMAFPSLKSLWPTAARSIFLKHHCDHICSKISEDFPLPSLSSSNS